MLSCTNMEVYAQTQQRIQCVQHVLARRPWLPWIIPALFAFAYHACRHIVQILTFGVFLPNREEAVLCLGIVMGIICIPLYRMARIHSAVLFLMLLCIIVTVKHTAVCVLLHVHCALSTPIAVTDGICISLVIQQWYQHIMDPAHGDRQVRRWVWSAMTCWLPLVLVPQMMLLTVVM